MLGYLLLHDVPMPKACLPAVCPSGDMGAGLCVPAGMLEQGWVSQQGRGSMAGCPGHAGAGPASAARAAAHFPRMQTFG